MSRTGIEYSTRNDDVVKAGRMFAQKLSAEEDARNALRDAVGLLAMPNGTDSVRLATEALDHAALSLDGAILDFAETIKASFLIERIEMLRETREAEPTRPTLLRTTER